MITDVKLFAVYVGDQDRALDFYTKKLGFKLIDDTPMDEKTRWIEVSPPGGNVTLALFTPPGQENLIGKSSQVSFNCDDIYATYEELKNRGVKFSQEPKEVPWGGAMATFEDPDGNFLVLSSQP
ncbi:MAG TPA: VOC family protein [Blastocatellia bacterium]|nr:VOC family protein [Blastocatellia bacterium]